MALTVLYVLYSLNSGLPFYLISQLIHSPREIFPN